MWDGGNTLTAFCCAVCAKQIDEIKVSVILNDFYLFFRETLTCSFLNKDENDIKLKMAVNVTHWFLVKLSSLCKISNFLMRFKV